MKKIIVHIILAACLTGAVSFTCLAGEPEGDASSDASDASDSSDASYDLDRFIRKVLKANIALKSSKDEIEEKTADKAARKADFFPVIYGAYQFEGNDQAIISSGRVRDPKDEYTLAVSFRQPLFDGFSRLNRHRIATLDLESARLDERLIRQNVIFDATSAYFLYLRAKKQLAVADETEVQIKTHEDAAEKFFEVGMTPLHDLLQARVLLANARQDRIVALNNLETAKARMNKLARRRLDAPIEVEDILDYAPLEHDLGFCIGVAEKNRLEPGMADLEIEIAEKEIDLAKKEYYPEVNLEGYYFKRGAKWNVNGGEGIYNPEGWNVTAAVSFKIWDWGGRRSGVAGKRSRLSRVKNRKTQLIDDIRHEVHQAYLKVREFEKNIVVVEKAIEEARENYNIVQGRYNEQLATSMDILDARVLLSRTENNYYNALYNLKIAHAALDRAMGVGG